MQQLKEVASGPPHANKTARSNDFTQSHPQPKGQTGIKTPQEKGQPVYQTSKTKLDRTCTFLWRLNVVLAACAGGMLFGLALNWWLAQ